MQKPSINHYISILPRLHMWDYTRLESGHNERPDSDFLSPTHFIIRCLECSLMHGTSIRTCVILETTWASSLTARSHPLQWACLTTLDAVTKIPQPVHLGRGVLWHLVRPRRSIKIQKICVYGKGECERIDVGNTGIIWWCLSPTSVHYRTPVWCCPRLVNLSKHRQSHERIIMIFYPLCFSSLLPLIHRRANPAVLFFFHRNTFLKLLHALFLER